MAAPSALAAVTPVTPIVQSAVKVLSTELVRFEGKVYRRIRLKEPRRDKTGALLFTKAGRVRMHTVTRMEPIAVSATLNPIGLGVLGILGAATAFVLFGRIAGAVPLIGEYEIYKGPLADEFDGWKKSARCSYWKRKYEKLTDAEKKGAQGDAILATAGQLDCSWVVDAHFAKAQPIIEEIYGLYPKRAPIGTECADLYVQWKEAISPDAKLSIRQQARALGCSWAG